MMALHLSTSRRVALACYSEQLRIPPHVAAARVLEFRRRSFPMPAPAPAPTPPPPARTVKMLPAPASTTRRLIKAILAATAERYGLKVDEILGRCRDMKHAHARQIAMYLCRTSTPLSLPRIGEIFRRDHTTILHGCRAVTNNGRLLGVAEEIATAAQSALRGESATDGE
jgi:hypothetical protein